MMAQPSDHAPEPSFYVIGPQFIAPNPVEVIVQKFPSGNLVIKDINHQILLKVKPHDSNFHHQRLMLNANDEPIMMLREKNLSMHKRWEAFMGEGKADSNMIFSTKNEHLIQFTPYVSVLLASKSGNNDNCGLKIEGSWKKKNCTIGDSSTTMAQMHKPQTLKKMKPGEEEFMVTIQPNVDYAFVIALFAIVDAIENPYKKLDSLIVAGLAVQGISGLIAP